MHSPSAKRQKRSENHMLSPQSERQRTNHIVLVTGGVMSGIGKGITASSIGVLLKDCGWRTSALKIDPYLNFDSGTMSPFEHGECYVLDDGGETDLDLGNYERFLDIRLNKNNSMTTGKVYKQVIDKERKGDYLGKTVQVVPHITNAIQEGILNICNVSVDDEEGAPDFLVIELGGTVGDIESAPFVEALRQLSLQRFVTMCHVHVSLVPLAGGEQKTKPTQHGVQTLRSLGLSPDIICCRCDEELLESTKKKLALFCNTKEECIISMHNVPDVIHVPLVMNQQRVASRIASVMDMYLGQGKPKLTKWKAIVKKWEDAQKQEEVKIALVGKYTGLEDSYLSYVKALKHASMTANRRLNLEWINADDLVKPKHAVVMVVEGKAAFDAAWRKLKSADGVMVPGGFGARGVEGKVLAVRYARENAKPFLGVCLGMQAAVVEYARNVLGKSGAHSQEFDSETAHPVIIFMPEGSKTQMGGTMRLGSRRTVFADTSKSVASRLYAGGARTGAVHVDERHRHRYEVNPEVVKELESGGLMITGKDETGQRMEVVELPSNSHPFFVGVQYHPELKSRAHRPSPLFVGLMMAASGQLETYLGTANGK